MVRPMTMSACLPSAPQPMQPLTGKLLGSFHQASTLTPCLVMPSLENETISGTIHERASILVPL